MEELVDTWARVLADHKAGSKEETSLSVGEEVKIIAQVDDVWAYVEKYRESQLVAQGYVPVNCLAVFQVCFVFEYFMFSSSLGYCEMLGFETPLANYVAERARVVHSFAPEAQTELPLSEGDIVYVYEKLDNGWWYGEGNRGSGYFPATHVQSLPAGALAEAAPATQATQPKQQAAQQPQPQPQVQPQQQVQQPQPSSAAAAGATVVTVVNPVRLSVI